MKSRIAVSACIAAFVVGGSVASMAPGSSGTEPSFGVAVATAASDGGGFAHAVAASHERLARAERLAKAAPRSWIRKGQLAGQHLQHARLTGDYDSYAAAERAVDEAFALTGGRMGPHLVRAELNYALHRFDRVARDLETPERMARHQGDDASLANILSLRGALAMQAGRYAEAKQLSLESTALDRSYSNVARLADYHWKTGGFDEAETLYGEAQGLLSSDAREASSWIHLQLGLMDLDRGAYDEAMQHYQAANQEFPGWWLVEEHIAEIDATQGRTDIALARYRDLIDRTGEPEFMDALASLEAPESAQTWVRRSRARYEERLERYPEASYGHALDHFLKFDDDASRAVRLAEENAALRPNGRAKTLLAQAYLKANRVTDARTAIDDVLGTDWVSAETHATAALTYARCGEATRAWDNARAALAISRSAVSDLEWLARAAR